MGTTKQDQERVRALLKEAITVLCKNGLQYRAKFSIEGLLGITLDDDEVFLVSIHEQVGEEVSKILQQKELPPPASPLSRTAGSSGGSQPSHSAPASPRTPGSKKTQSKKSTVLPVTVNLDQEESDNSRDSMGQSVLDSTPSGHSQPLPGSMASPSRQSSSNMEHNQRKRPRDSTASPNGDDQHQNFGSLQLSVDDIPGEGAARSGDDADTGTRLQSEDSEHSAKRRALDSSHTQSSADSDILSNIEVKQEIEEDEEDLIFVKEEGNQNPPSCQLAMSQSSSSEMMLGGVPQFSDSDQPGPSHWDPLQGPPQNLHGAQLGSSPAQDSQSGASVWRIGWKAGQAAGLPMLNHIITKNHQKEPRGRRARLDCVVCSNWRVKRCQTVYWCQQCEQPMCQYPCFSRYHSMADYKITCYAGYHDSGSQPR